MAALPPPSVRIFNVFHQRLFPELMLDVPLADRAAVVLYGVNETIAKELPATDDPAFVGFPIVLEYRLPDYRPWLQARGYCQTSSLYHVFKNNLDDGADYVGWSQYDMKYYADTVSHVRETVAAARGGGGSGGSGGGTTVPIFYEYALTVSEALSNSAGTAWQHVLDSYNRYFGTAWTWEAIAANPRVAGFCPVVHTFVLPREMFRRMMAWMCDYLDAIQAPGAYRSRLSQAEFAERVHGLFLALECARPEVVPVRMRLDHQWPRYHDQCPFDGYKTRVDT